MRYFLLVFIYVFLSTQAFSQSIQINTVEGFESNSNSEFSLADQKLIISDNGISFLPAGNILDVNAKTGMIAHQHLNGVTVYNAGGSKVAVIDHPPEGDDSSRQVYAKPDGSIIVRENIVQFLLFDTYSNLENIVSNSSGSEEGESISQFASDALFKTVVLYNPKILRNGVEGSRAQLLKDNGTTRSLFNSNDRIIDQVKVNEDGQFIGIVSSKPGTEDQINILDRFGNELGIVKFNQAVAGFQFSSDGRYLTVRSNNRVAVYSVLNGERAGSTSFRNTVHFATYAPDDNSIFALTADRSGNNLSRIQFHVINISAGKVKRQDYNSTLGITDYIPLKLERKGAAQYILSGLSKSLVLKVQW